jgi:hypothetical protein
VAHVLALFQCKARQSLHDRKGRFL